MLKASPQLLVNGNCANGITNWTVQTGIVYTDSTDYALFTNQQGNSTSYVRCNPPSRVEGHKYAYIIGGKASINITWGSRNSKQFGTITTTDSIQAGIDEFPSDGAGYPWVALPIDAVFYLNKNVGFRMYDLTALGLDSTITTAEQVINYFGNKYLEPSEIYYDGTVETVTSYAETDITDKLTTGYYITDSGTVTENAGSAYSDLLPVVEGVTYGFTLNSNSARYIRVHGYDSNGDWTVLIARSPTVNDLDITFTVPTGVAYVRFSGPNKTVVFDAYTGGSATCQPLLSVGDYKDVQNITSGAITRNVGIKVLD